jgi:hypothetical protein
MIAGNVFTVHASRCKLHERRTTHFTPPFETLPDDAVLPSNSRRNQALNEAVDDDAANQFAMAVGEHWSSQGDTTAEGTGGDQVQEMQRRMQMEEDEGIRRIAADEADFPVPRIANVHQESNDNTEGGAAPVEDGAVLIKRDVDPPHRPKTVASRRGERVDRD